MIPQILDDALGFNIYRTGILFRRELMRALSEWKMMPEQWTVMAALWATGKPLSQNEIVQLTLKDKHTVSRIIQRLERDGWIVKQGADDARINMIAVTKKGMSFKNTIHKKMNSHFIGILTGFDERDEELLLQLLKKLRRILGD